MNTFPFVREHPHSHIHMVHDKLKILLAYSLLFALIFLLELENLCDNRARLVLARSPETAQRTLEFEMQISACRYPRYFE